MADRHLAIAEILEKSFPSWEVLTENQQQYLLAASSLLFLAKGEILTSETPGCAGVLIMEKGSLRFYTLSEEGKEITLQRLGEGEVSVLSASCVLPVINFDIWTEALEPSVLVKIKPCAFAKVMRESLVLENACYRLATKSLAGIAVSMQRMFFTSFDRRLAHFLLEEMDRQGDTLQLTHEQMAKYIGTAREVVTRMLNQFADAGYVELTRGKVKILQPAKLEKILQGNR